VEFIPSDFIEVQSGSEYCLSVLETATLFSLLGICATFLRLVFPPFIFPSNKCAAAANAVYKSVDILSKIRLNVEYIIYMCSLTLTANCLFPLSFTIADLNRPSG
jgi:hypothetical protein